jgi:histidine ammonia-lyase
MSPGSSDLPRFLSPIEGQSGFATVQKTVSALTAEIQHRAMPMPVVLMPVADRVEDYATMALTIVEKTGEIVERLRLLAAIELMVAAQACDLRAGIALGNVSSVVHDHVRSVVAPLRDDRPISADILALEALIRRGVFDQLFPWPGGDH